MAGKEAKLKDFLDSKVAAYNRAGFIESDPVCIPHRFSLPQDIEISAFFAAIFAWGHRTIIIKKATALMELMDNAPYQFITQHQPGDLKRLMEFKHRTFNGTDLLYFIEFFEQYYATHPSLESAFLRGYAEEPQDGLTGPQEGPTGPQGGPVERKWRMEASLNGFYHTFFSLEYVPARTRKHIASPEKNATCKRINMFLRWMVRKDDKGVDFGLWKGLSQADLICPIDLHVARVARRFGLLQRPATDWKAALELTDMLRGYDPDDPVKYDFALFGLGAMEKF
jgi:uncharacterized protein (TIGR02757 family)